MNTTPTEIRIKERISKINLIAYSAPGFSKREVGNGTTKLEIDRWIDEHRLND